MHSVSLWHDSLLHLALKGAGVLAAVFLLGLLLRRLSGARRYLLWVAAAIAVTALPLAIPFLPAWRVLPPVNAAFSFEVMEENTAAKPPPPIPASTAAVIARPPSLPAGAAPPPVAPATALPPAPTFSRPHALAALPLIWLGIGLLMLARIALSAWRLHRLEKSCPAIPAAAFQPLAAELGLRRLPKFLLGPRDAVPMVWGILRPRLLLPEGFQTWPPNKLRSVLLHEFAHLQRHDPAGLCLAQFMQALHWFNPLAWLTLRRLRTDQERACDDTVLRHGIRPSDYAQHLLDLSRHTRLAPGLSLCALAMTSPTPVEARVTAILDPHRPRDPASRRWSFALITLTLLVAAPLAMLHALEGPKLRGRILDRHGIVLAESSQDAIRRYPLKTLTSHLTGYVRQPDERRVTPPRIFGGHAIEAQADVSLAAGKDVSLTLDARIQQIAHRAIGESGFTRAAVVVLDPRNGDVLAMLSLPSYDPNTFIPAVSEEVWKTLLANKDNPLLNRSVRGYTPGAAFLPVTALAGISAGHADAQFECTGTVTYGKSAMQCWINAKNGSHGTLNMQQALVNSCHCYWYQMANAAGVDAMTKIGRQFGLGSKTAVLRDDEDKGIMPGPEWLAQHRPTDTWGPGHTANLGIGQGSISASPLQMAIIASALANGGKVPKPRLLHENRPAEWTADLAQEGLSASYIEAVRKALWENVNGERGTAKAARSDKHPIAGQTGTAQNWRRINDQKTQDNHGWFIGFAPYEKPTLAFAIFVQGIKSAGFFTCAPIAKRIVEESLALAADGSGRVEPVPSDSAGKPIEKAKRPQPVKTSLDTPLNQPGLQWPILAPSDEKRWRHLQRMADLQELPRGAHDIRSSLEGERFPRTSTLTFQAPRDAARAWLNESPGHWRYNRGMLRILSSRPKASTLGTSIPPDLVAMSGSTAEWISGSAEPSYLPDWPATGRVTVLCSGPAFTHCTVTVDLDTSALVKVTIQAATNPSRIRIAD
ncbi:MAG TPA: penicillin-binding transpeptidase domain-containing protein [Prosthecobacter sp.]|nr:penicillin-binding transpeptidase domain-containing protein [Prosthecobacter sp.]